MQFSQVKGQKALKERIISLIDENRFPHAVLFNGKDGYGNLALALATAQYISCTSRIESKDSCSECLSCKKYQRLVHPDLHLIFPNTTTKSITKNNESKLFVNQFRDFVLKTNAYCSLSEWYYHLGSENKQGVINVRDANTIISDLTLKTYESPYKILIIWNIDKMTQDASDKILKILEEPYPNTFFLLTTENKDKIIPTILSRVQQIIVPRLDNDTMYYEIKQLYGDLTDEEIKLKVALCDGDYNKIKQTNTQVEQDMQKEFMTITRLAMMYRTRAKEILDFVDVFSKHTRDELKASLSYFLDLIDKCYLYNNGVPMPAHPLGEMEDRFKNNFPQFITQNNIESIYHVIEQAQKNIDFNSNNKINIFDMIIKLGRLLN